MLTATVAGLAGQVAGSRRPLNVVLSSVTAIGSPLNVSGRLPKCSVSPTPAGSPDGRTITSAGSPRLEARAVPGLATVRTPARSPALGGAIRKKPTLSGMGRPVGMPSTIGLAVTVPVPIWQAGTAVLAFRQAPPSIEALASRPGGRATVRSLGESVAGFAANLTSSEMFALEPAWLLVCFSVTVGVTAAEAVAGARITHASAAAVAAIR